MMESPHMIHYLCILCTRHYAQSYYNFGKSLSAPCLFYQYDFQIILFQSQFINKFIMYFIIH